MNADPVADQAGAVLGVLDRALPPGVLLGAYLDGSAVAGGLNVDVADAMVERIRALPPPDASG